MLRELLLLQYIIISVGVRLPRSRMKKQKKIMCTVLCSHMRA